MRHKKRIVLRILILLTFFYNTASMAADLPPPLRVFIPFEAAWAGMQATLKEDAWIITGEDRGLGFMQTAFKEYISGPLTDRHIGKIGEKPELADAYWLSVQYQYEIAIDLVGPKETLVTIDANIRALKRDFFGKEDWVEITTNGQREELLLTEFGKDLFGQQFELNKPKFGFWRREPKDFNNQIGQPRTASPERP